MTQTLGQRTRLDRLAARLRQHCGASFFDGGQVERASSSPPIGPSPAKLCTLCINHLEGLADRKDSMSDMGHRPTARASHDLHYTRITS